MPEGLAGFALALFVIVPVNVFAGAYVSTLPIAASLVVPLYLGLVLVTNFVLLEAFIFLLPGFTVSSQWSLLFFAIGLSALSDLVRYIPDVSDLVPPGILQ
jgi:membrane-anchored protein YejM (alkaline phosphatase superfamily)